MSNEPGESRETFEHRAPVPDYVDVTPPNWTPPPRSVRHHADDLDAERTEADTRRGAALGARMLALGLPITPDVERDVAGFERHVRASEQVGIGARAHTARDVLPALDRAMQHGPQVGDGVVLDAEVVRKLRNLAYSSARVAERIGVEPDAEGT